MSTEQNLYSAMQTGKPYKTYKKVVLGRVYVSAIDPFTEQPTGIMLYGDPKRNDESCFIDMWSERDNLFFIKMNKVHLDSGFIIETARKVATEPVVKTFEQYNDEELKEVINMKYLALQAKLNKTSSEAILYRMLSLAEEMEKSTKIVGAIQARLSEVNTLQVTEKKDGSKA